MPKKQTNKLSPSVRPGQDRRAPKEHIRGAAQTARARGITQSKIWKDRAKYLALPAEREIWQLSSEELHRAAETLNIASHQQMSDRELAVVLSQLLGRR